MCGGNLKVGAGCSALIPIGGFGGGDFGRTAPCMALVEREGWEKRFTSFLRLIREHQGPQAQGR